MSEMDFVAVAAKWQELWYGHGSFEPVPDSTRKKFFFTVPYPYVSGLLHVGHGRTYTNGDVIARYKRMAGFNVLWPMAFHITGTPVLAISGKIAAGEAQAVKMFEEYVSIYEADATKVKQIVQGFADPWKLVNYFSGKLVADFQAMGYSLDFSRQFTTGDKEYNRFVEWQFRKFADAGLLRQADYPLLYCVNDKNAVGEDDIKDADTEPVEVQRFVAVKFALEGTGSQEFLVSATLRPDTIFGVTNMFVRPDGDYAKIRVTKGDWNEVWWVGKKAADKLSHQGAKVEFLGEAKGESFVGKRVTAPATGASLPVLPASFVDAYHATGFVHSVPAHAPYDFVAIEELKKDEKTLGKYPGLKAAVEAIVPISLISLEGYGDFPASELAERLKIANTREKPKLEKATGELYKAEFYKGKMKSVNKQFAGMTVAGAKDAIAAWLKKDGHAADFFETSRPAVCRCGGEVVAAVMPGQWFIDYNSPGWKEHANACLSEMLIYPPQYRHQLEDVFAWLDKRPCARRRGLGTQLPFNNEWIIESLSDSTIYMSLYTIIKGIREYGLKPEQLLPEFFDYVFLGKGDPAELAKLLDTSVAALAAIRSEFAYWYPNDLRHTGIAHITNHLPFFIFAHTAIFNRQHWPKGISLNALVVSEGSKMSKSKGNVVLLHDIAGKVGPDVFRLYSVSAADFASMLDYRAKEVEQVRRSLNKFASIIRGMDVAGGGAGGSSGSAAGGQEGGASRWFLSKFEAGVRDCTEALEELRLRDYVQTAFYGLLGDYDYFLRRATASEKAFVAAKVRKRWIALLAPVVPHACEELWAEAGGEGIVSHAAWPLFEQSRISPAAEAGEDLVRQVVEDGRKIQQVTKRAFAKMVAVAARPEKRRALELLLHHDSLESALAASDEQFKPFVEKNFYALKARGIPAIDEFAVIDGAKAFISRELGLGVEVQKEESSNSTRAAKAMPGKPAIEMAA